MVRTFVNAARYLQPSTTIKEQKKKKEHNNLIP
jgi:hypothetical protein